MSRWIPKGRDPQYQAEQSYESSDNESNLAMRVQHKHTAADTTTGPAEKIYPGVVTSEETHGAQVGQHGATQGFQQIQAFTPSVGMHSVGDDHIDCFTDAVDFSGGVRQGRTFVSDPAPGVARCDCDGNDAYDKIHVQTEGAGETFEMRQHSRWAGNGG